MKDKKTINRARDVALDDLYSLKIKAAWNAFWQEGPAFVFLCFYFFFEYVRPQSIYPFLEIIPWAQILLILTFIVVFFDRSVNWTSNIMNKFFIIFIIVVLISSFLAFNPSTSWAKSDIFVNWILVYFLVINILNNEKRLFIFMLLFLLFSFKMSQHGFFTWAERGFSFAKWGLVGASAWFRNSGEFAIQMLIFSSLSGAFVLSFRDKWDRYKRWFLYCMPITGLFSIVGSDSRGAQIALGVIGLWLMVKTKLKAKTIIAVIIVLILGFYFLPEEQIERFKDIGDDKTSQQRIAYIESGLNIIKGHPIIGIGYYNWRAYGSYYYPSGVGPFGYWEMPHNIYIQIGAESGLLGLGLFLIMILITFKMNQNTRKIANGNNFLVYTSHGLDLGMVGYLVAGSFVSVF